MLIPTVAFWERATVVIPVKNNYPNLNVQIIGSYFIQLVDIVINCSNTCYILSSNLLFYGIVWNLSSKKVVYFSLLEHCSMPRTLHFKTHGEL